MQEIEVPPRDSFKYYVKVTNAPKTIMWNFSTRRKNINFGLFLQKEEDSVNDLNSSNDTRSLSTSLSKGSSLVDGSPVSKKKGLISFTSSKKESHDSLDTPTSDASFNSSSRKRNKSQTTHIVEHNLDEILPIQRYESAKAAVKGQYQVTKNGVYVLYFDNTFSINTSKKLIFFVAMHDGDGVERTTKPDMEGWLLKKKRKKMQGWAKRFFICDKGQLAYYKFPGGYCRGSIPITYSTLSIDPDFWIINIDSGTTIWHLRATNKEDFELWLQSIKQFKAVTVEAIKMTGETNTNFIPFSPQMPMDEAVKSCLERLESQLDQILLKSSGDKALRRRSSIEEPSIVVQLEQFKELLGKEKQELLDQLECEVTKSKTLQTAYQDILKENNELKFRLGLDIRNVGVSRSEASLRNAPMNSPILSAASEKFFDAEEIILSGGEISDDDRIPRENKEMIIFERSDEDDDDGEDDDDDSDYSGYGKSDKELEFKKAVAERTNSARRPSLNVPSSAIEPSKGPVRRKVLPSKMIEADVSLIGILRKNVGKDLSTVTMPISLNEPINLLQKLAEDLEYSNLLDRATEKEDPLGRLIYISTFAVASYANTAYRSTRKPFNPLQNETYECVRPDRNFKYVSEKVSHNPPIMACHAMAPSWIFFQDSRVKTKFWGKSMELIPSGKVNVVLPNTGDHYQWTKVTSCMRNIIGGTRSLDHYGKMVILNKKDNYRAEVVFKENSSGWLGGEASTNEISGAFFDPSNKKLGFLHGKWSESLFFIPLDNPNATEELWSINPPIENKDAYYGFTQFTIELNEITEDIRPFLPPTDTRWRPDQRLYEEGNLEEAEKTKTRLEEKQRAKRKKMDLEGTPMAPKWFTWSGGKDSTEGEWIYKGGYWEAREDKNWGEDPDLW